MLLALVVSLGATASQAAEVSAAVNPVRKVVSLLQMMQKKVTSEGETEKDSASHGDEYNTVRPSFLPSILFSPSSIVSVGRRSSRASFEGGVRRVLCGRLEEDFGGEG